MNIVAKLITAALFTSVVACSSDDDDNGITGLGDTADGANQTSMPAPGADINPGSPEPSPIDGTWVSNCGPVVNEFEMVTLVIADGVENRTIRSFTDSDCSVPSVPGVLEIESSLEFPAGVTQTSMGDASFINQMVESLTIEGVSATPAEVAIFTGSLGFDLDIDFDNQMDIFLLASDGRLFFGDRGLSNVDERPQTLNTAIFYTQQ